MKLKAFVLLLGLGLPLSVALRSLGPALAAAPAAPDGATVQTILQSSVQIILYAYDTSRSVESGGRGLGTLVRQDGQTLIVTHDHWSFLNERLHEVEFRDARGQLLVEAGAHTFRSLIRYRDGGTMILAAPQGLVGLTPVVLDGSGPTPVRAGDVVWVARRDPARGGSHVIVVGRTARAKETKFGRPVIRLHGAAGDGVRPGDSGGGVWLGTQLLGNVWSGGVEIRQTSIGGLITSRQREKSLIFGALLPGGDSSGGQVILPATYLETTVTDVRNLPE